MPAIWTVSSKPYFCVIPDSRHTKCSGICEMLLHSMLTLGLTICSFLLAADRAYHTPAGRMRSMSTPTDTKPTDTKTDINDEIGIGNVTFAKDEIERRRKSPVYVSGDHVRARIAAAKEETGMIHLIDPKLGFNNRAIRLWINFPGSGEEAWEGWDLLGHRHLIDAVIYIVQGHGYSIIDGVRYDWGPGDLMCVPTFAWHRHVNTEDEPVIYIASTTTPYSMSLGVSIHEDERYPEYWVFAQKGDDAQKTLIPGGTEAPVVPGSQSVAAYRGDLTFEGQLYEQQVAFAVDEEKRRRVGRVLVKASDIKYGWTRMGKLAYIIDQRMGFNVRVMATVLAEIDPGHHSGAHRHLY